MADLGSFAAASCHALVGIILFHFLLFSCDQDTEHGEGSLEVIIVLGEGAEDAVAEERLLFFGRHLMDGDQDIITAIKSESTREGDSILTSGVTGRGVEDEVNVVVCCPLGSILRQIGRASCRERV